MRISCQQRCPSPAARSGQALVEFAIIALVLTFLLGAMLSFGFLFFGANVLQQAADVAAMELARQPLPPGISFVEALQDPQIRESLYDETRLVVPVGTQLDDLPLVNRLLFSLYLYDPELDMLRFPGALVENSDGDLSVLIPIIGSRDPLTGAEFIAEWRPVVEEIRPQGETAGPFSLSATAAQTGTLDPGMVALRINYPFQSGALVAYRYEDSAGNPLSLPEAIGADDLLNIRLEALDADVTHEPLPGGYSLANTSSMLLGSHTGEYGLGRMSGHATFVRPYRKVLAAQAIYRREVFAPSGP